MRITGIDTWEIARPLKAPFVISYKVQTEALLHVVRVSTDNGISGIGCCVPNTAVTGETPQSCANALDADALQWLDGETIDGPARFARALEERLSETPAARAAIEMAVWDAWAKNMGAPLCDLLGRAQDALPTSMTLGIRDLPETIEETRQFLAMGYTVLKVKLGNDVAEAIERVRRVREAAGNDTTIRVDPNQAFDVEGLEEFLAETQGMRLEFVEQPLPVGAYDALCDFPEPLRRRFALDEDLCSPADAITLAEPPAPAGIYNIKLSKCGGIHAALGIARIAEAAGIDLMWGCMIESGIGLAAALHAALACPNTRYLDLDGDYDLLSDICSGGNIFEAGMLRTNPAPGLGVSLNF